MKIYDFYKKHDEDVVVIAGFFDCIHAGHLELIERGKTLAKKLNATAALFTFSNDPAAVFNRANGLVLTFEERLIKLEKHRINTVITCDFTKDFALTSRDDFLKTLTCNFRVKGFVCGYDYTFGYKACGNRDYLKTYCEENGIAFEAVDEIVLQGKRISTTLVKEYLSAGDIKSVNKLLADPYFIKGIVVEGRKDGRKLGFPTANLLLRSDKYRIKRGVYKTRVIVDGKEFKAITNYGTQPTFNADSLVVESHLKGFSSDLYGKEIIVIFDDYIRDIVKFYDIADLKKQLEKDMEVLK